MRDKLDKIIEEKKGKLEKIANQNSEKLSVYMKEFEKFVLIFLFIKKIFRVLIFLDLMKYRQHFLKMESVYTV